MWPRPPAPMTTTLRPRAEHRDRLLDRVDRRQPRVGQRRDVGRLQRRVELHDRPRAGEQEVGEAAVAVMPGNEPFSQCMSSPARQARHSPQVMNGCTMTVSPTSTFVTPEPTSWIQPAFSWPGRVGQLDLGLLGPLALLDVQVGAAEPRRADAHDRRRAGRVIFGSSTSSSLSGSWYACRRAAFMPPPPRWSGLPYRTRSSERHRPPLVSRLRLTSRARRSHVGQVLRRSAALPSPATSAGDVGVVGQPELCAQRHAAPRVGARREVGDAQRRDRLGVRPSPSSPWHTRAWRATQRLALEELAQGVQRARRSRPGTRRRTSPPRATAALISAPV